VKKPFLVCRQWKYIVYRAGRDMKMTSPLGLLDRKWQKGPDRKWQKIYYENDKKIYYENDKKKFTMKMRKKIYYENDKHKFTVKMTKKKLYRVWEELNPNALIVSRTDREVIQI
jgi:hypothetical protein